MATKIEDGKIILNDGEIRRTVSMRHGAALSGNYEEVFTKYDEKLDVTRVYGKHKSGHIQFLCVWEGGAGAVG